MGRIEGIRRLFRLRGDARGVEGEVEDELAFHLESRIEALVAEGLDREEAAARARREFGDVAAAHSELSVIDRRRDRRTRRRGMLDDLRQDVRLAARSLARRPSYLAVAILTLAVGIGAVATIFAVVDAALLRPLPFPSPDRLAVVWGVAGPERDIRGASFPELRDWSERTRSFSALSIYDETGFTLSGSGPAEVVQGETVSPGYLEMLGATPVLGRFLRADDDRPGITPTVVISHALWQRRFGGTVDIVGRSLVLDGRPVVVIGVAAEGFHGLSFDTDVWATLPPFSPDLAEDRGTRFLAGIGRLAPSATRESAQRGLEALTADMEAEFPAVNAGRRADLFTLREYYLDTARTVMLALLAAVALLLLIACVNVLNLQLVRGLARQQEVAVRYALGARRGRVVRQLLTESLVLAALGGAAGLVVAWWGTRWLIAGVPPGVIPTYAQIGLDARVVGLSLLLVLLTGMLSGALPALRSARGGLAGALRSADRSGDAGGRLGLQHALVAVEVGMAVALMLAAVVMIRSVRAQLAVEPGFDPDGVTAARVFLPSETYADAAARVVFADRVLTALRADPAVAEAAIGSDAPLRGNSSAAILRVPEARGDDGIRYYRHMVTPSFFGVVGIDVVRGRGFEATDAADAAPVAIVSRAFAQKLWPDRDGLGERIEIGGASVEIVGIVADARYRNLTANLMDAGEDPDVWFSWQQIPTGSFDIVVRQRDGGADGAPIHRAVAAADPSIPVFQISTLRASLDLQTATDRFGAVLLALFGVAALLLAAIGLFGVMSFAVSMRRREIAIRIALGSAPSSVLTRILGHGLMVTGIGALGGLVVFVAAGRLMSGILFGVSPLDPLSMALVVTLLGGTAAVANLIPAARASRTDPQQVLRGD